ncbi:MAG: prepilin-type N-terminal cleavage/methylation domain-containing protein [Coprobacillus sp.]
MSENQKGFTLIEIIVSIAIASIVLMIAGTLILSSSSLLTNTSETDIEKRTVDSIIDFVRSEVEYSSDVRLAKPNTKYAPTSDELAKGDWHSIYVKDGYLYRDEKQVFNDGFYSHKELEMSVKGHYQNSQRIDISYSLKNDVETKYTSKDTIILLNFSASDEIKENGLYTADSVSLDQDSTNSYIIYYNKKYTAPAAGNSKYSGTVADIIYNIYWGNCNGTFYKDIGFTSSYTYKEGEIIYNYGYWWECITNTSSAPYNPMGSSQSFEWKCLYRGWTNRNSDTSKGGLRMSSGYEEGDIVIYGGRYYKAKKDIKYDADILNDTSAWEKISVDEAKNPSLVKTRYPRKQVYQYENVLTKYLPSNINLGDPERKSVSLWESDVSKKYKVGDIVKRAPNSYGYSDPDVFLSENGYYPLYIKIFETTTNSKPGSNASSGWLLLDVNWYQGSSYNKGDVILGNTNDFQRWLSAVVDINNSSVNDISNDSYWKNIGGKN